MRGAGVRGGERGAVGNDGAFEDTGERGVSLEDGIGARDRRHCGRDGIVGGRGSSCAALFVGTHHPPVDRGRLSANALHPL